MREQSMTGPFAIPIAANACTVAHGDSQDNARFVNETLYIASGFDPRKLGDKKRRPWRS